MTSLSVSNTYQYPPHTLQVPVMAVLPQGCSSDVPCFFVYLALPYWEIAPALHGLKGVTWQLFMLTGRRLIRPLGHKNWAATSGPMVRAGLRE